MIESEILRFASLGIEVRSDVPEVADYCRRLFHRLRDPGGDVSCSLELMTAGPSQWHIRDAILDATVDHEEWLAGIICARVLETFGNDVLDHDLFHGAALSRNGHGLVLCGESGFGKSTLTLALLARGWKFLSDEVAVFEEKRPQLVPFPKALELLPESAAHIGLTLKGVAEKRGKTLHDPESLFDNCMGEPCPARAVVFMDTDHDVLPDPTAEPIEEKPLRVVVHRRGDKVIGDLLGVEGVVGASWNGDVDGCPVLEIERDSRTFPAWRLDEILGKHGLLIVTSSAEETPPADFSGEPRLEPLPTHAGVARMMTCFRGRRAFKRRLDEHDGDFAGLFLSFLDRMQGVQFYRLIVGQLDAEIELLEQAMR